jgi:hypothetical protein
MGSDHMGPQSIANGDYTLVCYAQSASRAADWYRVARHRRTRALSCDCPRWTFNQQGNRTCKHTDFAVSLLEGERPPVTGSDDHDAHPFVTAVGEQFPGLRGHWQVREQSGRIAREPYRAVRLQFTSGNGDRVQATLALALGHRLSEAAIRGEIAIRLGYAIALELAHCRGIALDMRPPSHYQTIPSSARRRAPSAPDLPAIEMDRILRIAGTPAQGSTPVERAEGTLRLMLGDALYTQLLGDGYLDVPSAQYAACRRVYRLRRDPARLSDKRVRVFEAVDGRMTYVQDFCIVRRSSSVPEADHFLTKWLGLLSDERRLLEVVGPHNIFAPYSDDYGRRVDEPTLPVWNVPGAA